jgi:two-component system, cell cycle sensor histidine kinase and response regulator CckA
MRDQEKSKKELIEELKALLLRVEELEVVERKYRELTEKIQVMEGHIAEQNAAEPVTVARQGVGRATVLVVDDNDVFRKFMQEALRNEGYTVYAAGSSAEALHILEDSGETVDLMISDVIMPEGSGNELYKNVKAAYPHIKVLFVSGYTDEILIHTDVQEVIESKAAFLQKPFTVADFLKKVNQELGGN